MLKSLQHIFLWVMVIVSFSVHLAAQPCYNPLAQANPCIAPVICNGTLINNYCGSTNPIEPLVSPYPFCGAPNNNQFIAFVAGSTNINIQFNVDLASCTTTPDGTGVQAEIYSTTNCANGTAYTSVSNCLSVNASSGGLLTATGLNIGQTYYLMVDGWSGDLCNYSLDLVSGTIGSIPPPPPMPSGPSSICPGSTGTYTISGTAGITYSWTVSGGGATISGDTTGTSINVNFPTSVNPYNVTVCVNASSYCGASANTCKTVNVVPVVPVNPPTFIICSGDAFNYNGTNYTNASASTDDGTFNYVHTLDSYLGCDSIVTITIIKKPNVTSNQIYLLCEGESVTVCGQTYNLGPTQCSSAQIKVCTDASASGCDSTITINLTKVAVNAVISPANPSLPCGNPMATLSGAYTQIPGCFGTITYQWTNLSGTVLGTGSTLNVTSPGSYVLMVTNTVNLPPPLNITKVCSKKDTVVVTTSGGTPATAVVTGNATPCLGASATYAVVADPTATTYAWTLPVGASITAGANTNSIIVLFGTTSGNVCCAITNSSCISAPGCLAVVLGAPPSQPTITGPAVLCANTGTYSIPAQTGATYNWTITGGAITTGQGTVSVNVNWGASASGTVAVTVTNACGNSTAATLNIIVNALPNSNAGANISVCGMMTTLAAVPSVGTGTWTHTGPGGSLVTYGNANAANSTVTVNMTGNYTFTWTENNNGCMDNDQVTVNFNAAPSAGAATETCNGAINTITVSFNITGGTAPYTVVNCATGTNAGAIAAGVFTSTSIASPPGVYCFILNDANSCGPDTLSGIKICDCITSSANMNATALSVCEGQQATATTSGYPVLDGNDVVSYVLHTNSGSSLGTVIATSATPVFSFQAPMVYGTTYYISQIVGDNNGSGQVSVNDPCLSVASGQPVTFYQLPNTQAGPDNETCGTTITLNGTPSMGFGQWTQTSGLGTATFDNASFSDANVTVDQSGVYTFTWTEDNNGCTDADQVTISFNSSPMMSGPINEICNGTATAYTLSFTVNGGQGPYSVNGSTIIGNTFTSASIPSGTSYTFTVEDANSCSTTINGSHTCNCTTQIGSMTDTNTLFGFCTDQTACVVYDNTGEAFDADDVMEFVLSTESPFVNIIATSTTPCFDFVAPVQSGIIYYITAIIGNNDGTGHVDFNDPCISISDGTPIEFFGQPTPIIMGNGTICSGQSATLTATGGNYYIWSSGLGNTATVTTPPLSNSTSYVVTVTNAQGCSNTDVVTVNINPIPIAQLSPYTEGCSEIPLTLTASGGATYTWLGPGGITGTGNPFTINDPEPGYYSVTATANGCSDTAMTLVSLIPFLPVQVTGDTVLCSGESTILTAVGQGDFTWDGGVWNGPQLVLSNLTSDATHTVLLEASSGCSGTAAVHIEVNPRPNASISGQSAICLGTTDTLTGSPTGGSSYIWYDGTLGPVIIVTPLADTSFRLILNNQYDCPDTVYFPVSVYLPPVASAGPDQLVCHPEVALEASYQAGAVGYWTQLTGSALDIEDVGDPNTSVSGFSGGTYSLQWTLLSAICDATDSDSVSIVYDDRIPLAEDDFSVVLEGQSAMIQVLENDSLSHLGSDYIFDLYQSGSEGTWTWDNNSTLLFEPNDSWNSEIATAFYRLCNASCIDLCDTAMVTVRLSIPDEDGELTYVITADGNGKNDVLFFDFIPPGSEVHIYNRWGSLLYHSTDYLNDWRGLGTDGHLLPQGTYYFVLRVNVGNGDVYYGSILLLR